MVDSKSHQGMAGWVCSRVKHQEAVPTYSSQPAVLLHWFSPQEPPAGESGDEQHFQAKVDGSGSGSHRHGGGRSGIPGCTSAQSSRSGRRRPGQSSTGVPKEEKTIKVNRRTPTAGAQFLRKASPSHYFVQ